MSLSTICKIGCRYQMLKTTPFRLTPPIHHTITRRPPHANTDITHGGCWWSFFNPPRHDQHSACCLWYIHWNKKVINFDETFFNITTLPLQYTSISYCIVERNIKITNNYTNKKVYFWLDDHIVYFFVIKINKQNRLIDHLCSFVYLLIHLLFLLIFVMTRK